jgi:hypothetical protein
VVSRFFIKDDFSWTEGEEKKLSGGEKVDEMLFVLEGEVNGADVGKGAVGKGETPSASGSMVSESRRT